VSLSISLDTHDPIKYERIRGADQLDHVLAGLELLRGYQPHPSRRLLAASKGRALQMNAGAKQARREWLLFLHADTALPVGALQRLNEMETDQAIQVDTSCTGSPEMIGGFDSFRSYNFRCTRSRIIYGDQALFVRRTLFEKLGGFPNQPILEDVASANISLRSPTLFSCHLPS